MSYQPGEENFSEFITSWATSNQTLPTKTSGSEVADPIYTFNLDSIEKDGEAILSSNQVDTNFCNALWTGDIRSNAGTTGFNAFSIEFENSDLIRSAAFQDQRTGYQDDMCYAITDQAKLKLYLLFRCGGGSTIQPYVRIFGVLVGQ